jgi:hypothetical protein
MRGEVKQLLVGVGLLGTICSGCKTLGMNSNAQTYPLQISRVVPAAKGDVVVTPQEGANQRVRVEVDHMAPPDLASKGATTYVVWLKPDGTDTPQNVGTLPLDNDRKGTFETTTALRKFEVMVTPEQDPQTQRPSKSSVLKAQITPKDRGVY